MTKGLTRLVSLMPSLLVLIFISQPLLVSAFPSLRGNRINVLLPLIDGTTYIEVPAGEYSYVRHGWGTPGFTDPTPVWWDSMWRTEWGEAPKNFRGATEKAMNTEAYFKLYIDGVEVELKAAHDYDQATNDLGKGWYVQFEPWQFIGVHEFTGVWYTVQPDGPSMLTVTLTVNFVP